MTQRLLSFWAIVGDSMALYLSKFCCCKPMIMGINVLQLAK